MKSKIKLFRTALCISLLLALLIIGVALAAVVIVDTFDDGTQSLIVYATGQTVHTGYATGTMIGDQRDTRLTYVSGSGDFAIVNINFNNNGKLDFSQTSNFNSKVWMQWDGNDSSMALDYSGLSGADKDLTGGGTNTSFRIRVNGNDNPMRITINVYTDASNWSYKTFDTPGGVSAQFVDMIIPFATFNPGGTGSATFSNVGAIEMYIDGTLTAGSDLNFDLFEATADKEYGDLPNLATGNTPYYSDAIVTAYHIPQGLRLGQKLDAEASPWSSANADGDDNNDAADEDGVTRDPTTKWTPDASVKLLVTVAGCPATLEFCYLNGWIDWNNDGNFAGANEQVLSDNSITNGLNRSRTITVGNGYTTEQPVYARFRICESTGICNTPSASPVTNGEIEDYKWYFGPTAIVLSNLTARSAQSISVWVLAGLAALLVCGLVLVRVLKRRQA